MLHLTLEWSLKEAALLALYKEEEELFRDHILVLRKIIECSQRV